MRILNNSEIEQVLTLEDFKVSNLKQPRVWYPLEQMSKRRFQFCWIWQRTGMKLFAAKSCGY